MLTKPVNKTLKNGKIFCTLSATVGTALVYSCKGSNSSTVYFTGCISQSERESVGDLASASACCRVLMLPLSGNEWCQSHLPAQRQEFQSMLQLLLWRERCVQMQAGYSVKELVTPPGHLHTSFCNPTTDVLGVHSNRLLTQVLGVHSNRLLTQVLGVH